MTFNFAIIFSLSSIGLSSGLAYGEVSTNPYQALEVRRNLGVNARGRGIMARVTQISNLDDLSREQKDLVRGLLGQYERLQKAQRNDGLAYLNAAVVNNREAGLARLRAEDPYEYETQMRVYRLREAYQKGDLKMYGRNATGDPISWEANKTDMDRAEERLLAAREYDRQMLEVLRRRELRDERLFRAQFENGQSNLLQAEWHRASVPYSSTRDLLATLNERAQNAGGYTEAELDYIFENDPDKTKNLSEREKKLSDLSKVTMRDHFTMTLEGIQKLYNIPRSSDIHSWYTLSNKIPHHKQVVDELVRNFQLETKTVNISKSGSHYISVGLTAQNVLVHSIAFGIMVAREEADKLSKNSLVQRILALEVGRVLVGAGVGAKGKGPVDLAKGLTNLKDLQAESMAELVSFLKDSASPDTLAGKMLAQIKEIVNGKKTSQPETTQQAKSASGMPGTPSPGDTFLNSLSCKILLGAK